MDIHKTFITVLQFAPTEELAFHCRIVCLLNTNKFDEALNHINRNSNFSS